MFESIEQYNENISNNLKIMSINEYFKDIYKYFYSDIDTETVDYLLELSNDKSFCIQHEKLFEYDLIMMNCHKKALSCLEYCMLKEDKDYIKILYKDVVNYVYNDDLPINKNVIEYYLGAYNSTDPKINTMVFYVLKQSAFKECLMLSKRTNKYRRYFTIFESIHANYYSYQMLYYKKLLLNDSHILESIHNDKNMCEEKSKNIIEKPDLTKKEMQIIVKKFISNASKAIYDFNEIPKKSRIFFAYILKNTNVTHKKNFRIIFVYEKIMNIPETFKPVFRLIEHDGYEYYDIEVFGLVTDFIYSIKNFGKLHHMENKSKDLNKINELDVDEIIDEIHNNIKKNKIKHFQNRLDNDKILQHFPDKLEKIIELESNKFQIINKMIYDFITEKFIPEKSFRCYKLSCEVKKKINFLYN